MAAGETAIITPSGNANKNMETKTFPLNTILTVTTGRLLTTPKDGGNGIGDLYEILGWMTNDSPMTHQLPRFANECKPWLLKWFPELESAASMLDRLDELLKIVPSSAIPKWLAEVRAADHRLNAEYAIPRIPADKHESKDAITELVEMVGDKKKIVALAI